MNEAHEEMVEMALAADREAALRDVFAASAMSALVTRLSHADMIDVLRGYTSEAPFRVGGAAYVFADAMLKARKVVGA